MLISPCFAAGPKSNPYQGGFKMRNRKLFACAAVAIVALFFAADGHANGSIALTGKVSSQKEHSMEGVVGGAKKEGSTITVDVVSDAKGRYAFPGDKLEPGHYNLKI